MRICPVRKIDIIILYIDDFEPMGADPDICQDFQDDIDALDAATYPVAFELWFDNFENKIGKALTLQLTGSQAPDCGGANPPTIVSFNLLQFFYAHFLQILWKILPAIFLIDFLAFFFRNPACNTIS